MAEPRDAYARLPFQPDRTQRSHDTGGGLTFFDVADWAANVDTVAGYLREVPLDLIGRPDWVLARWGPESQGWTPPAEAASALQTRLVDMGSVATAGVIVFEVAATPAIVWSPRIKGRTGHEPVLLARARAAEMEAFLQWGHALWHPDTYHYVLPSRKHTSTFIRLADAFQDLRAAAALATWLYGALNPEAPTTVVMDIGTLMPVVGELQRAAESHRHISHSSARIGKVLSLDRYPSSSLGLHTSLLSTSPDSPMLGLMSVSDSGGFAQRLLNALSALGAPTVRIEQFVSRQQSSAAAISEDPPPRRTIEAPWLGLGEPESTEPDGQPCRLCQNERRARLVTINPRAMSALVLPEPDLIVPDIFDARRNASVWEAYGRALDDAVNLVGPTGTRPPPPSVRAREELIFFEPARLVKTSPATLIKDRLAEFEHYPKRNRDDTMRDLVQHTRDLVASRASVVIYDTRERDLFTDDEWQALAEALGEHDFVSGDADWIAYTPESDLVVPEGSLSADSLGVLVLVLGARTGLTCQRMFLTARQQWPSANFRCMVLHAHPDNERLWASIRNNLTDSDGNKRLLALWLSHIPSWSPLVTERDTYLAAQKQGMNTPELLARLDELEGGPAPGHTLLGRASPQLLAHSYFGQELGSRETLCAVGSAMQSARIRASQRGAPHWAQFDLRRVLRSYFDGLIHACILRWCEPQEAWWGPDSSDCCNFLQQLEGQDFDFDLLLPELLLAGAQEKLPEEGVAQVVDSARDRISRNGDPLDERTRSHLRLGIDLCELALTPIDTH